MTVRTHTPAEKSAKHRFAFSVKAGCVLAAALFVAGCEPVPTKKVVTGPPPTPPEFYPCRSVAAALSEVDAIVRKLGQYSQTAEGAYWVKRQERLIARAYECR